MSDLPPTTDWRMYYVRDQGSSNPVPGLVQRLGEIDEFTKATFVLRLNDVGSFVIDADPWATGVMAAINDVPYGDTTRHVELVVNGRRVFLGPIQGYERRLDTTHEQLSVFGADQNVWLAQRVAHPRPLDLLPFAASFANPPVWPGQAPVVWWTGAYQDTAGERLGTDNFTGPAGQAITYYISRNLGTPAVGAPTSTRQYRRRLTAALPGPAIGAQVTMAARFQNLLELVQGIATQGGAWPIAFSVDAWGLRVWNPLDRGAIFSTDIGNIKSYLARTSVDDTNFVYVAGQGENQERQFAINPGYGDYSPGVSGYIPPVYPDLVRPPLFGIVESFRDRRDTNDWAILQNAAVEDCRAGIRRPTVSVTALDTPTQQFGRDYDLGDLVTIRFAGTDITALVTALTFTLEAGRPPTITPTLGTDTAVAPINFINRINQSSTRLRQLERR